MRSSAIGSQKLCICQNLNGNPLTNIVSRRFAFFLPFISSRDVEHSLYLVDSMTTRNQPRLAGDLLIGQKQRATTSRAAPKKHVSSVPDVVEEKRSVRGKDGQPTTCHVRYKKERFLGKVRPPSSTALVAPPPTYALSPARHARVCGLTFVPFPICRWRLPRTSPHPTRTSEPLRRRAAPPSRPNV